MSARHLVDPELLEFLDSFPPLQFSADHLHETRQRIRQMTAAVAADPDPAVDVCDGTASGPDGREIGVAIYRPRAASRPLPALLEIHAGGHVAGSARMTDAANRALAADLGAAIVSVDYRLAPETPFPGPVEDCYHALRWLHASAGELGIDPARIGVSGRSSGGGLAAAVAILARDRGEIPLLFQHLISPMLDDRTCTAADPNPCTGEFLWTRSCNQFSWRALLGREPGADDVSPYAAPARVEDPAGLAPAFFAVGALDLFLDENLQYARRLSRAGVPVELHVYPGAFHGFDRAPSAHVALECRRSSRAALHRVLHPQRRRCANPL